LDWRRDSQPPLTDGVRDHQQVGLTAGQSTPAYRRSSRSPTSWIDGGTVNPHLPAEFEIGNNPRKL
jgi:hypothetical protein